MKKLLVVVSTLVLLSTTYSPVASASNVAQTLCEYVSADDKKRLRSYLKSNKLKIRQIFDGVQCNGQNLLSFASSNNAVETGTLMINKLPKSQVKKIIASINSSALSAAAQKRISS